MTRFDHRYVTTYLPTPIADRLREVAESHRMTTSALVRLILTDLLEDSLFRAVLDQLLEDER